MDVALSGNTRKIPTHKDSSPKMIVRQKKSSTFGGSCRDASKEVFEDELTFTSGKWFAASQARYLSITRLGTGFFPDKPT